MATGGGGIFGRLKQFDAYPKTLEDFRVKTFSGATSKRCQFLSLSYFILIL